jgi:hypothetical protein
MILRTSEGCEIEVTYFETGFVFQMSVGLQILTPVKLCIWARTGMYLCHANELLEMVSGAAP